MTARLIGPFLMIAMGVALLLGTAQTTTADVGTVNPCIPAGATAGVVNPCTTTTQGPTTTLDPCVPRSLGVGIVDPCTTTTTEAPTTTAPTTTAPATTAPVEPTTTEAPAVSGEGASTTTTAPAAAAAATQELPRTGSDNLPLTGAAIGLIVLGVGLAIAERRHQVRRNQV